MKKLIKQWSVLLLAGVLSVSIVGCSKDDVKPPAPDKTEGSTDATGEDTKLDPMTISIGYWDASDKFGDNDEVLKRLSEKFNVTFESRGVSWSDFNEKYKLWAASGELPDIFATDEINSETYNSWIDQGVVKALPEDLSKYPNINAIMTQPDVVPLEKDGLFYMVPRLNYPSSDMWRADRGIIIRRDWLEALGLEAPKTYDDYVAVLEAFVAADFDGNGANDTIGLTHKSKDHMDVLFNGTIPQVGSGGWVNEDGQWIPAFYSKHMAEGVRQVKNLYDKNLLDKDFGIMQTNDGMDKFAQGNVGMITQQVNPSALRGLKDKWVKFDHDVSFEDAIMLLPGWEHADGNRYTFTQTTYWSESYFNGDMDDDKLERILMIYEYLLSDEFIEMKTYGIEGVEYKKDGDKYEILMEKNEDDMYELMTDVYPSVHVFSQLAAWNQELELNDNEINKALYGEPMLERVKEFLDLCETGTTPTPLNFDIKQMSTPAKDSLSAIRFMDDVIKVVLSGGDVDTEWAKVRKDYEGYNVKGAIDEVNTRATELGMK